jgi:hypothetical protein
MKNQIAVALALVCIARSASAATPAEQYQQQMVGVDDVYASSDNGVSQFQVLYQGKYKQPLSLPAFLRAVDRPDLADEAESRQTRRTMFFVGGSAAILAGAVAGVVAAGGVQSCDAITQDCGLPAGPPAAIAAGGALVGMGLYLAALVTNPDPVDAPTLRRLADEHNQSLRANLGLSALPNGAAVALSGSF